MSLKVEIAAIIRALRTLRGAAYEDLAEASSRKNLGSLEQGKSNITIDKLVSLAAALEIDPVALLALAIAEHKGEPPEATLARSRAQIDEIRVQGGLGIVRGHIEQKKLVKRSPGKPGSAATAASIKELKDKGYTQPQVMEMLGLAKSTVWRYWNA